MRPEQVNVLVTGATGFVGRRVIDFLRSSEYFTPIAAIRRGNNIHSSDVQTVTIENLDSDNVWGKALNNIQVVIHTAARVHIMNDDAINPLSEFRRINVEGTLNLARQAAYAGVKRFIFLSSVKVNGESTMRNQPFTESDIPAPIDPYGISKYETEKALHQLATETETEIEVVCIRPPLVYGPGVKANFLNMMKWLYKGIPLPFGSIHNKRSLVALDNLVDLIICCINHPAAKNQVFFVSDGVDLSITELLKRISILLGKKTFFISVNQRLLEVCFTILGKKQLSQRLCASLQVDISNTKKILDWSPPINIDEGLHDVVKYFLDYHKQEGNL